MIRFNYLDESFSSVADRLGAARIPDHLRTPLVALLTLTCVVFGWWCVEQRSLADAELQTRLAQERLDETRAALAQTRIARKSLDEVIALDQRLRAIRSSGSQLGFDLADISGRLPTDTWLLSLSDTESAIDLTGRSVGFDATARAVAGLTSSKAFSNPELVRATREEHAGAGSLVSFEIRARHSK